MAGCESKEYAGRLVALEYSLACGDVDPSLPETNWLPIGAFTSKDFSLTWDTSDVSSDQTVGGLRANIATFKSLKISGSGFAQRKDGPQSNLKALTKHVANPGPLFSEQPVAWLRMTFPDLTFIAYMIINDLSRSAPSDTGTTFSLEAMATNSDFGLIVEDTPDLAATITSVTVNPTGTVEVAVGGVVQMYAGVAPAEASQVVTWTSATPATATVDSSGKVTGVAPGTVLITATSAADTDFSDSQSVTVV